MFVRTDSAQDFAMGLKGQSCWSFRTSGPRLDRHRPDACCPVVCTLPDACSVMGFACLMQPCGCSCCGMTFDDAFMTFLYCCTPCCTFRPIVEAYVSHLPRPATHVLLPDEKQDGQYRRVERSQLMQQLKGDI